MTIFLRMKAWQLFLLIFAVPFILIVLISIMMIMAGQSSLYDYIISLVSLLVTLAIMGWFWTAGTRLNNMIGNEVKRPETLFRGFVIFLLLYGIVESIFSIQANTDDSLSFLSFFSIAGIIGFIYLTYYVARALTLAEQKPAEDFTDFTGAFFLILFYPIGIWFIQPRINRLFEFENTKDK